MKKISRAEKNWAPNMLLRIKTAIKKQFGFKQTVRQQLQHLLNLIDNELQSKTALLNYIIIVVILNDEDLQNLSSILQKLIKQDIKHFSQKKEQNPEMKEQKLSFCSLIQQCLEQFSKNKNLQDLMQQYVRKFYQITQNQCCPTVQKQKLTREKQLEKLYERIFKFKQFIQQTKGFWRRIQNLIYQIQKTSESQRKKMRKQLSDFISLTNQLSQKENQSITNEQNQKEQNGDYSQNNIASLQFNFYGQSQNIQNINIGDINFLNNQQFDFFHNQTSTNEQLRQYEFNINQQSSLFGGDIFGRQPFFEEYFRH